MSEERVIGDIKLHPVDEVARRVTRSGQAWCTPEARPVKVVDIENKHIHDPRGWLKQAWHSYVSAQEMVNQLVRVGAKGNVVNQARRRLARCKRHLNRTLSTGPASSNPWGREAWGKREIRTLSP